MPNNQEHCEDSFRRYGKTFEELHRWMDEPSAIMGASHRRVRHDPYTTPQEAKRIFGENADHACLDHIRLDELENRRKGITKTPKATVPNPVVGVMSLILSAFLFFGGIYFLSNATLMKYGGWLLVLMFFGASIFFFLIFIGSSSQSAQKETPTFSYPITKPPDLEPVKNPVVWEQVIKKCSKCGANYGSQHERCPFCGEPQPE